MINYYKIYRYSPKERAKIGKYAMIHGVSAATKLFSRKLNIKLSETTVHSIHDGYLEELKQRRWAGDSEPLTSFPEKQYGRSLLLGNNLDEKLQLYVNKIREGCGVVSSKIVMAAARGMLLASDRSKLAEYGGISFLITTGHIHF